MPDAYGNMVAPASSTNSLIHVIAVSWNPSRSRHTQLNKSFVMSCDYIEPFMLLFKITIISIITCNISSGDCACVIKMLIIA